MHQQCIYYKILYSAHLHRPLLLHRNPGATVWAGRLHCQATTFEYITQHVDWLQTPFILIEIKVMLHEQFNLPLPSYVKSKLRPGVCTYRQIVDTVETVPM